MTPQEIKDTAARLASRYADRSDCVIASRIIAAELQMAYNAGYDAGRVIIPTPVIKSGPAGRASFPESLERVDWSGVIGLAGSLK